MNHVLVITALLLIALFANPALAAEPACPLRLPAIFGDNMVLQSGMPVKVWGWAAPGQKVTVKIAGQEKTASADEQGRWLVKLDALQAGGLLEMTVAAGEQTLAFKNVLAGEVWVCSGQSNMGTGVGMTTYGLKEISEAKFPKIRIFAVPMNASPTGPAEEIGAAWGCFHARWMECTPETIGAFPAVGYFFAKKVHKETGLPMGMIESVWGGTGQEAWLSRQGFESDPDFKPLLQQADDWLAKKYPDAKAKYEAALAQYEKAKPEEVLADDTGWETVSLDERDWKEVKLPGTVSMNGVAWFRRAVTIPSEWSGKDLKISLGNIPDEDVTYVNGTKVGGVNDWDAPREYDVSAELVKSGRAVIALRVTGYGGGTGPAGTPEQMLLLARRRCGRQADLAGRGLEASPGDQTPGPAGGNGLRFAARQRLQRHDRPADQLRHSRRAVVPGRRRRLPLRQALPRDDTRLAKTVGPGRFPVPLRAARPI